MPTHQEIREQAKKRVEAKKGFYVVALVFAAISAILVIISLTLHGWAAFWVRFPILIFALVGGILYVSIFGLPGSGVLSSDWEEREIEKEVYNLYRQNRNRIPPADELTQEERLELKELERLKKKWEDGDDFV